MNEPAVFEKLKTILREHTSIKVEITRETALLGQHVLDSMDFMNYLVAVESAFGVTLPDDLIAEKRLGVVGNMAAHLAEASR